MISSSYERDSNGESQNLHGQNVIVRFEKENGQKEFGPLRKTKLIDRYQKEYVFATHDGTAVLPRKCNSQDYGLISPPPSQSSLPAELPPTGRQHATWDTV